MKMVQGGQVTYAELKSNLPAPARQVIEDLIDARLAPEDVLRRIAREFQDETAAYAYVREVLYRSLIELTGANVRAPLTHPKPAAVRAADPMAAG
ncbi:MAG TPA: hypothetical protein QGH10_08835 [Armatimonadota bacterium]|nr:hypothetical protein [Armatimonadota bacterium]